VALALAIAFAFAFAFALAIAPAAPASAAGTTTSVAKPRVHHRHKPKAHAPKAPAVSSTPTPTSGSTLTWCADGNLVPGPDNVDRVAAATLCLINQQRALAGVPALHWVTPMTTAATAHSLEMVAQNYVSQDGPDGNGPEQRLTQTGYVRPNTAVDIAENVAAVTGTLSTPVATVAAWMHSPSSRAVILSARYTDTGIGVIAAAPAITGSGPGATYTEDFGVTS